MGDLQVDLNAALVAVKKKCVDLEETVRREDLKPQNRGRGYLGVKRYIYALTTKNNEHALNRRGRSLTRVYVEQKFYRSKSVPTPDQVQRLEDCTQDYGPNGEMRLEFTETVVAPIEELIKEDQSHQFVVSQRLPQGHAEWDHELAVFEEDGASGLLEDRTLTVRAGDHPFNLNQFSENAEEISSRIAEFFGSHREEENRIRSREMSLSVHPVYHDDLGNGAYTSFGMSRSKSVGNVHQKDPVPVPRLESIHKTTNSLSNIFTAQTRHDHDSKYGHYVTGYGQFGVASLPPPKNAEVMPKMPKREEHVYAEPIVNRRDTVIFKPKETVEATNTSVSHTTTNVEKFASTYERKYDFKTTFPPGVELPEGYHDYYDPSKFMFLDSQGYYQGNITRPLHYTYGRGEFELYSDYSGSRRASPMPPVEPEPEPIPEPEPEPIKEPVYVVLQRTQDLPKHDTHLTFSYPDYYDQRSRIILSHTKDPEHLVFDAPAHPEYYDNAARIILHYTHDLEHQEFHVAPFPEYYDLATRYPVLHRTEDIVHDAILINEYPAYKPYEVQEVLIDLDEEPIYDEIYEPVLPVLHYHHDIEHVVYLPEVPYYPPPPPPVTPPPSPPPQEIHVAIPVQVIPEPPIPAERHYDELYIGQEALDVSVSPTFGQVNDQKNLGLEKSVHDRVREMEASMRSDERMRLEEEEKRRRYEERQLEIREARLAEEMAYNAYEEVEERKITPAPQPIQVPDAFIIPDKPKRTWQPPPKEEIQLDEHEDKPLGPVIFHELIYQQGILRRKYEEEQRVTTRPVAHPVSRATSRPSTPGPEFREIDFPRLDEVASPRGHADSAGNVDYVQKHIERYNANDAQDSTEIRQHAHVNTVSAEHQHQVHHEQHHHHTQEQHHHTHSDSVVYDEPSRDVVYDIPHDEHHHHHHHHQHHEHTTVTRQISDEEEQRLEQLKLQKEAAELQYQLAQTNLAIRQMSKSNKWSEEHKEHKEHKSESVVTTTTTSVLHHSNSLNRQNIPAPLTIQNGNSEMRHSSHELHHVHYSDEAENHQHHQHEHHDVHHQHHEHHTHHQHQHHDVHHQHHEHHHHQDLDHHHQQHQLRTTKSTTSLEYAPLHVGHVKNLALKFNKVDEKPITTEQVIYRIRAAPPGHHFQQEIKPRPRSLPRVPMDEVELHEHGGQDHLTRHHHEQQEQQEHREHHHQIGGGVTVHRGTTHHTTHYYTNTDDDTPIKVRKVYKAQEDTSMLSPVSMTHDEPLYDVPN